MQLVNELVSITYGRLGRDYRTGNMYVDVTITNTSAYTLIDPMFTMPVIHTAGVSWINPNGSAEDGQDAFYLGQPLEAGGAVRIRLYFSVSSSRLRRIDFELDLYAIVGG